MRQTHPFEPIIDSKSELLILGSFPSLKSFENDFYYAHPRNQFWPIMSELFGVVLETKEARRHFCLERGIALWDVYGALTRTSGNSSDANLADLVPNDIPGLLQKHSKIRTVFCTGKKAYDGLRRTFPQLNAEVRLLPSTSPAYAALSFEAKCDAYRAVKDALG